MLGLLSIPPVRVDAHSSIRDGIDGLMGSSTPSHERFIPVIQALFSAVVYFLVDAILVSRYQYLFYLLVGESVSNNSVSALSRPTL